MNNDLYIMQYNPLRSITHDHTIISNFETLVEPFFKLEDAINRIKELNNEYDVEEATYHNEVLSEIKHYLIGKPYDEYTRVLEPHFPILMKTDYNGDIIEYSAHYCDLLWTKKDMVHYNGKYKIGDIIDVYKHNCCIFKGVIADMPKTIFDYCNSESIKHSTHYVGGYYIIGHNPYILDDDGNREIPYYDDIEGYYDDSIKYTNNNIDEGFFKSLSIYAKFCNQFKQQDGFIYPDEIDELYYVDVLYDLYFKEYNYAEFNRRINMMIEFLIGKRIMNF